jgi:hypothetical protein
LLTLCAAHHRAVHEGTLVIGGSPAVGLSVHYADGTPYGAPPVVPRALVQARAFQALRGSGFSERDAKAALRRTFESLEAEAQLDVVLRHCLELLTEGVSRKAS